METKTGQVSVKQAGEGKATVVIATMGVKDRDGDVILPGAFGEQIVPVVGAHEWRSVPIGKARVFESGSEAIAEITFNTETTLGKDWYEAIKFDWANPPARQQYSWGFSVSPQHMKHGPHNGEHVRFLKATDEGEPLPIHEVSPVLVGAGANTRSVSVKEGTSEATTDTRTTDPEVTKPVVLSTSPLKRAVSPHQTKTDDKVWDATLQQRLIKESSEVPNYFRQFYAIADHGDETKRASWRFLHHFVTPDGEPGAASVRACLEGIMTVHKGVIPSVERRGVYDHLAAHLKDAGVEPPEYRATDAQSFPLDTLAQSALWGIDAIVDRIMGIHEIRSAKGMTLTQARIDQLQTLQHRMDVFCQIVNIKRLDRPYDAMVDELREQEHLRELDTRVQDMATRQASEQHAEQTQAAHEHWERFQALQRKIQGDT